MTSIKLQKRQKQYDKTCSRSELSLYGKELHEDSQNFAKKKKKSLPVWNDVSKWQKIYYQVNSS